MITLSYSKPISDLVKSRRSCRAYKPGKIDQKDKLALQEQWSVLTFGSNGLAGERIKFQMAELSGDRNLDMKVLDYGFIKNANSFLVGTITSGPLVYESYGFLMEQVVLKATELGLGTCWIGYFNTDFLKTLNVSSDEIVPAIIVIGNPTEKMPIKEKLLRLAVGAVKRKSWDQLFFCGDFNAPLTPEAAGSYAEPLEMVRLAPSAGNQQPWLIVKEKDRPVFHFYLKPMNPKYHVRHLHNIDIGIAMSHFHLSAKEKQLEGEWQVARPAGITVPQDVSYIISWSGR